MFSSWATPDAELVEAPDQRVTGATGLQARAAAGCDTLLVTTPAGTVEVETTLS